MRLSRLINVASLLGGIFGSSAAFGLTYDFSYTSNGTRVAGQFIASNTVDAQGFRTISALTGLRGEAAMSLLPAGTPIAGYAVDNLLGTGTRLITDRGIGFSSGGGDYALFGPSVIRECFGTCTGSETARITDLSISLAASATYRFSYLAGDVAASGTLVTNNSLDGDGYQLITALTGNRAGQAMSLLPTGTEISGYPVDNRLGSGPQYLTDMGLGFSSGGLDYALYGPTIYRECTANCGGANSRRVTQLEIVEIFSETAEAAVPEPASWAMMILGFGTIGAGLRSRRERIAAAT